MEEEQNEKDVSKLTAAAETQTQQDTTSGGKAESSSDEEMEFGDVKRPDELTGLAEKRTTSPPTGGVVSDGASSTAAAATQSKDGDNKSAKDKETKPKPKSAKRGGKRQGGRNQKRSKASKPGSEEVVGQEGIDQATKEFEETKAKVMDALPESYKARFGEVVFARYSKEWYPSLILSPYDVSPTGAVRKKWMEMFEDTKSNSRKLTYLVYYYGTTIPTEFYGFHPSAQIVTYEAGTAKGYHQISKVGQKKEKEGKTLNKDDRAKKLAMAEVYEDLDKKPEDRKRGESFKELHESQAFLDIMMLPKSKDMEISRIESGLDSSEDDEVVFKPKKKKVPTKRKPSATKKESKSAAPAASQPVDMSVIGDDERSSSGEDKDDESIQEPSSSSDDDDDYMESSTTKAKAKRTNEQGKKAEKKKPMLDRKRTKGRAKSKKKILEEERDRYLESLERFRLPLQRLNAAVKSKDAVEAEAAMKNVLRIQVKEMACSFIQESGVVPLVKNAKQLLKTEEAGLTTYKELYNLLKSTHEAKKDQLPDVSDLKGLTAKWRAKTRKSKPSRVETPTKKAKSTSGSTDPPKSERVGTPVGKVGLASENVGTPVGDVSAPGDVLLKSAPPKSTSELPRSISSEVSTVGAPRREKKSFTLGTYVRPSKSSSSLDRSEQASKPKDPRLSIEKTKVLPLWLTSPPEPDDDFEKNKDRTFAMEFIQSAATRLSASKVNEGYFSKSLEAAIFKSAKEKVTLSWVDDYWLKVHSLVGAICGKEKAGTIVDQIANGEFDTAQAIVKLDDDALFRSFEGI